MKDGAGAAGAEGTVEEAGAVEAPVEVGVVCVGGVEVGVADVVESSLVRRGVEAGSGVAAGSGIELREGGVVGKLEPGYAPGVGLGLWLGSELAAGVSAGAAASVGAGCGRDGSAAVRRSRPHEWQLVWPRKTRRAPQ